MTYAPVFRRVLFAQWLWSRIALVPIVIVAFAVPVLSVQSFNDASATGWQVRYLLEQLENWSSAYPILATITGLLLGITAWSADHRNRHAYTLSLPVGRAQFTVLRLGAGLALAAGPVAAVWIGALAAAAGADVPDLLQTYPNALAGRFLLATLVAFTIFFAISAGTARTAGMLLGAIAAIGLTQLFLALFGTGVDLLGTSVDLVTSWPGPLEVFGGRWLLIDF